MREDVNVPLTLWRELHVVGVRGLLSLLGSCEHTSIDCDVEERQENIRWPNVEARQVKASALSST